MRLKLLFALLAFFSLFIVSANQAAAEEYTEARPLKVGVIGPLTGDAAFFGNSVKNGMELALSDLPAEQRRRLRVIYEDDAFNPAQAVSAFQKLHSVEDIDLLVNSGSGSGRALSPQVEASSIPFLAVASDQKIAADKKFVMTFWVTPQTEASAVFPEMLRRGYKRIARVSTLHDFPEAVNRYFDQANQGRITLALNDEYPTDTKEFRTCVSKIKNIKDLDAVMLVLVPGQIGIFAKQLRQQGVMLPMFGYEFFEEPAEVKISDGALVGAWYVNAANASNDFIDRYLKRFPGASLFGAGNGYDVIKLLAQAVQQAKSRDEINSYLHSVRDFNGVLGRFSAASGNSFSLPAAIKIVKTDGFEQISPK